MNAKTNLILITLLGSSILVCANMDKTEATQKPTKPEELSIFNPSAYEVVDYNSTYKNLSYKEKQALEEEADAIEKRYNQNFEISVKGVFKSNTKEFKNQYTNILKQLKTNNKTQCEIIKNVASQLNVPNASDYFKVYYTAYPNDYFKDFYSISTTKQAATLKGISDFYDTCKPSEITGSKGLKFVNESFSVLFNVYYLEMYHYLKNGELVNKKNDPNVPAEKLEFNTLLNHGEELIKNDKDFEKMPNAFSYGYKYAFADAVSSGGKTTRPKSFLNN